MRHSLSWRRILLIRRFQSLLHHHPQVHSSSLASPFLFTLRSLSSLHSLSLSRFPTNPTLPKNPIASHFSSEPLAQPSKDTHLLLCDIFTKYTDVADISKELDLNGVVFTHEFVFEVLKSLDSSPDAARRFFNWVLERDSERLSSKAYNLMLGILGANGFLQEFWGLVQTMKKKGYGVSKSTRDKMTEKFEKEGLRGDLERLKGIFATGSIDNSLEKIGLRVSRIVRNKVWGENVEAQIKDLNVPFSSDLVKIVLENLAMEPMKALIFFRWIEESELFKHDERSYNAMARVLGRNDSIDRFWKVVDEMRNNGYEMEVDTYVNVLGRFINKKMVKEAVDLYEFAMGGANKPSAQCCTFLLRKIVVGKELDMGLLSRVVRIFTGNGNVLTDSMLDAVLKSLTSVGRFEDCNKVLKEMTEGGFVPSGNMQSKIAFILCSTGKKDEASEFVDHMETTGSDLDYQAWTFLVKGHCVSGELEKASDCFQKIVGKEGVSHAGKAFDMLVSGYCRKNRAPDAFNLLRVYANENQLKPWHTTYKLLIRKLLVQGGFNDALILLGLMKNHGFPPYVGPFIEHVSKSGTGADAVAFMKTMTSKKFPSISVVLRMFEAFFKARRHSEAQDCLSRCPGYIRNNADVLNLFCSMKSGEDTIAATSPVAV